MLRNERPLVSFTFDDFPRSAYLNGAPILEDAGARGTFYTAMGLMGKTTNLGEHFRAEDASALAEVGHEIANHTLRHTSARKLSSSVLCQEVREDHDAITRCLGFTPSFNFAYPYGEVSVRTKIALEKETSSCRGILPGVNGPLVDLNLLAANHLYGDCDVLGQVTQLLRENYRRNGWLIFYTHDVCKQPSRYGCTPGLLKAAVESAQKTEHVIVRIDDVTHHLRETENGAIK
jgi:peptidoglycan/xylan/chitin deacetylase (PgdA/CDA1 family)